MTESQHADADAHADVQPESRFNTRLESIALCSIYARRAGEANTGDPADE